MRFTVKSELFDFIETMVCDITFETMISEKEWELLVKVYNEGRYRKRQKSKLNEIREKWIIYNR